MELKYRARPFDAVRVDERLSFVLRTGDDQPGVIETTAAAILGHCLTPRSLDDHLRHVLSALGLTDAAMVRRHLHAMVASGLLCAEPASRPSSPTAAQSLDQLIIVTADRPAYLARCLESYLDHLQSWSRATPVLVVDASREAASARATEEVVASVSSRASRAVRYLGAAHRTALRGWAVEVGMPSAVADWLVPSEPQAGYAGAVRNQASLATAGQRVLSVDDDTVARVWGQVEDDRRVAFVGHVDPRDAQTFATRADALAAAGTASIDLLAAHESVLGRSLFALARQSASPADLDDVCPHLLPLIDDEGTGASVRVSWAGLAGDSGQFCPYPALFTTGTTRDRLASSDEALRLALSSREVVRRVRRATVTDEPWLMTYCAAFDHTRLVPPFSPEGRNEDGLFGAMLRMCDPQAYVAQIACGVVHDSARSGAYDGGVPRSATDIRLADLVQWMAAPWVAATLEACAAERMRGLGRNFLDLERLSARAFRAHVTRQVLEAKRRVLLAADMVLARPYNYPVVWRHEIRRYQQAVLNSIADSSCLVPLEYRHAANAHEAHSRLQRYFGQLGAALTIWPDLWDRCRMANAIRP